MSQRGFTLIELLLVIGILAILVSISFGFYTNIIKKTTLDSANKTIVFDLRRVKANSLTSFDNRRWGIHFVNATDDYYELFSTPTNYADVSTTIESTVFLPSGINFIDPDSMVTTTKDIVFDKVKGSLPQSVSISFSSAEGEIKTVTINKIGNIY